MVLESKPKISVVIVAYNMSREIPRTVHSFLPPYQIGLKPGDVEVLLLENGSSQPVPDQIVESWPPTVRYIQVADAKASPAHALNMGVEMSSGDFVCPVIDGARMASPGLLATSLRALHLAPEAFAATIGCHLGPKPQQDAVKEGYNQEVEDAILEAIDWRRDGYRLFEIAAGAGSSRSAWFGPIAESNAPLLSRSLYRDIGGYDERFDIAGGGLVNLDFFRRLVDETKLEYLMILGEATFHQFHGGVTTSRHVGEKEEDGRTTWSKYTAQYEKIRGQPFSVSNRRPLLLGRFPNEAARLAFQGLAHMLERA